MRVQICHLLVMPLVLSACSKERTFDKKFKEANKRVKAEQKKIDYDIKLQMQQERGEAVPSKQK